MSLPKRYDPQAIEPRLQAFWQAAGVYRFSPEDHRPVYSIDTPPPTVSGQLHLGHVYSYTHTDLAARFRRMKGYNVFYPMGYDDNGLPTERLVERQLGVTAKQIGREVFIRKCLEISVQAEKDYQLLWQRLGLSIDWRYTYRTIDEQSRRISQWSFLDLYRRGLVYRRKAPAIWCPECRTAIAQAELNDLERPGEFFTLAFDLENGQTLPIATTRPELLPACVAVFVHPDDERYRAIAGRSADVPLFGQRVPVLQDPAVDPEKGSGVVMCCTFGDSTDILWWRSHALPTVEALERDGTLSPAAGEFAGLPVAEARRGITRALAGRGSILDEQPVLQSVRVHERCDTPVEYAITDQWFMRVLDFKQQLLEAGEQINWFPEHMRARYRSWVDNLAWDWCISRQRTFGVPLPLWYCQKCAEVILADEEQLPVNPSETQPRQACHCGSTSFVPEMDVFDTWATSSMSPQIVGGWFSDPGLYRRVFPMSLRPQAHEIIRTWAFYTIYKSTNHFDALPWKDIAISGWGIAGEGMGKISKSRGGGPLSPNETIERYSADALRYWASSTALGKDALISEEKIQAGARLVTKLWNVARFSRRFLADYRPPASPLPLSPADRWMLSRAQRVIQRATQLLELYDYAAAKSEIENFFWRDLADNYLEMAKQRLYDEADPMREAARGTLQHLLLTILKLLAPFLPYVTEALYQGLFCQGDWLYQDDDESLAQAARGSPSIHASSWPRADPALIDGQAELAGEALVEIATAVRRYKSQKNLPLSAQFERLQLAINVPDLVEPMSQATTDLKSITRARQVELVDGLDPGLISLIPDGVARAAITAIQPGLPWLISGAA